LKPILFPMALAGACICAYPAAAQRTADPLQQARERADRAERVAPADAGPIVPDSQFDKALPPIDPALSAPLETIDAPAISTTPQATPAAPDPTLGQPLVPLAGFDVEPPAATAAEIADTVPELHYSVKVEGLDKIGLGSQFHALSALYKGDGKAANGAVISARAREDEALALRMLKSEGYYDGVVVSLVAPVAGRPGRVAATISASPGTQYKLGTVVIDGAETSPPGLVLAALALHIGDPIVAAAIEASEASVALKLPQAGYPFVKVGARDIELDDAVHAGNYTLPIDPGARSSFGTYSTTGKLAFDAKHVGVLSRFKPGELYDSRKVNDLREALVATGLFASVAVEPRDTGQKAADGTEMVDLLVTQNAGKDRRLATTAGYSTGQGIRLDASWAHRNLFVPEGSLTVSGTAGTQEQGGAVTFSRANAGRRDKTVSLALSATREDIAAYKALTVGLTGRMSLVSTPLWQKKWTWAYGFELLGTREDTYQPAIATRAYQNYAIAGINGQIAYDSSNSLLDPTRGYRASIRISPEIEQTQGQNYRYIRSQFDGSTYYPVSTSLVIAGRVRVASIDGAPRDDIAPSRRLYAGGGGSVRGFGYQELGPRDSTGEPVGGRSLVEGSIEARYRFGNFGVVPFFDIGQSYESSLPKFSDLRYGVGIGGRFYTNFGPLRLDVATPLGRRPGESVVAVYISIGQAF